MKSVAALLGTLPFLSSSLAAVVQTLHPASPSRIGLTIPLAKRFQLADQDGLVEPASLVAERSRMYRKLAQGFAAYERNTGTRHPSDNRKQHPTLDPQVAAQHRKRSTGADPLIDDSNVLWFGNITVGNPPVTYRVDFDTGSADLFLPGPACPTCIGHRTYNPATSLTSKPNGRSFNLSYGDGSIVQGTQFTDTVTIAGMKAVDQTLGVATRYSPGFSIQNFPPDGLMGMAYPQISGYNASPVFNTLIAQGQTTAPQFGFKLATSGSELFIGGLNFNLFLGPITQSPVTQRGFWQINLESVNLNGASVARGLSAIVDTGTSLIYGDMAGVNAFYSAIPGAKNASRSIGNGFFTVPCNAVPFISFTFSGRSFAVSPSTFNLGPVSPNSMDCVGGIVSGTLPFWIIGDVFLRNVYTAFDFGNNTVGFAALA